MKKLSLLYVFLVLLTISACSGQCIEGDCKNGQGTYTYDTGKYVGEWKDGKRHGQGTATLATGDKYVGEWKDGEQHGQGTATLATGEKYVGEFKDSKGHGQGTWTHSSSRFCVNRCGVKVVGEWKDGLPNGHVTITTTKGYKFVGEIKDGKRYGTWKKSKLLGEKKKTEKTSEQYVIDEESMKRIDNFIEKYLIQ